ncbi:MAG: 2Fe-2S iron-sulfur cluster binding domain-containing protein [Burkholderiaceae bacterium]|nr:2Fe-2S iron-sulfur cluster binding domain-containing protein [Burkholderiaceae bacterium]
MPAVIYIEHNGDTIRAEAPLNRNLMQVALDNSVAGILGDCGGSCSCATCHGYVDAAWADRLPPISETEAFMLEGVPEPRPTSRLCCQIRMTPELDGIVINLPLEQV